MPDDIQSLFKNHKTVAIGAAAGLVLALGYAAAKRRSGSAAQGPSQYLTPDVLAATPAGGTISITGPGGGGGGNPGVMVPSLPQPAPSQPVSATSLPPIDHNNYPLIGPNGSSFDTIGTITQAGGIYTGYNVGGGAPTYAYVNGQWVQDFNANTLPVGTPIAVPTSFQQYVYGSMTTEPI